MSSSPVPAATHTVVVLAGSPQPQGNGAKLQEAFVEGMQQAAGSALRVVQHRLHDTPIQPYSYPARRTPAADEPELRHIISDVAAASGVVVVTPTFNMAVPAPLKAFVDRWSTVSLDYKHPLRPGRPAPLLRGLPVQVLVSNGVPWWLALLATPIYPGMWLWAALGYFGARVRWRTFAGLPPSGTGPSPRQLAVARRLGARFARRVLARPPLPAVPLPW